MGAEKISRLCRSVLPAGFEQMQRLAPGIQQFLEQNLPESVCQSATLLSINADEVVIGASSPMVANYLRLHSAEIQQQLRETFGLEQAVRFRSIPGSLLKVEHKVAPLPQPEPVSASAVKALKRNAEWIEDDSLRAAIISLAESMED